MTLSDLLIAIIHPSAITLYIFVIGIIHLVIFALPSLRKKVSKKYLHSFNSIFLTILLLGFIMEFAPYFGVNEHIPYDKAHVTLGGEIGKGANADVRAEGIFTFYRYARINGVSSGWATIDLHLIPMLMNLLGILCIFFPITLIPPIRKFIRKQKVYLDKISFSIVLILLLMGFSVYSFLTFDSYNYFLF